MQPKRRPNRRSAADHRIQFELAPPPSIRWRLMLLVGLLVLVLVLMRYAAQPENWAWMGFPANPAQQQNAPSQDPRSDPARARQDIETRITTGPPRTSQESDSTEALEIAPRLAESDPVTFDLQLDFWTRAVRRLDGPSRLTLYDMFRAAESKVTVPPGEASANVVERLQQFHDGYTTNMLAQSGELANASLHDQQRWYDALFQWQRHWADQLRPLLAALAESGEVPESHRAEFQTLAGVLKQVAAGLVLDHSPVGRPEEIPYWNLLIDDLRGRADEWSDARSVQFVELQTQPQAFRGKPVRISGRIRGARFQPSMSPAAVAPHYFELWIQPEDGSSIPFCAYALQVPSSFPALGERITPVDLPAVVTGIFFKNQSYLAEGGKTQFCPVVLTSLPQVSAPVATDSARPPSPFTFGGVATLIVVLAAWIAWRVYRSTVYIRRRDSEQLPQVLKQLEDDPRVETVRDRLARWSSSAETDTGGADHSRTHD